MLSVRLLMRSWRAGELYLVAAAVFLAVMVVSVVALFSQRLELSLTRESNSFIAADKLISSSLPIPAAWVSQAQSFQLQHAVTAEFTSMLFDSTGEKSQLASVKAVPVNYPLRGDVEVAMAPFAVNADAVSVVKSGPAPGTVWVESRLFPLMDLALGSEIYVGEKALEVSRVIVREPDRGVGFSLFGARVLMNIADLPATEVIKPGSRIRYSLLLAGNQNRLNAFLDVIGPQMTEHQRIISLEDSQGRLSQNLESGKHFLLLAGVAGLLLSAVAIGISAQHYAQQNVDRVALLKSLGVGLWQVRTLYFVQLILLALSASAAGLLAGDIFVRLIIASLNQFFDVVFVAATWQTYVLCFFSGVLTLLFFALPSLWYLPAVAPVKILRSETVPSDFSLKTKVTFGAAGIFLYTFLFSQNVQLSIIVVAGLCLLALVIGLLAMVLLYFGKRFVGRMGTEARLAFASLNRFKGRTVIQLVVFSCCFMLIFVLLAVRTSLVEQWQVQLPEKAPNHFLVNISDNQVDSLVELVGSYSLTTENMYPMIRARLTAINEESVAEKFTELPRGLDRELNLTASADLADDNEILAGHWWDTWQKQSPDIHGVSVESDMAERLGLVIGDRLRFSVGGLLLDAEVASIRFLDWNSMKPNFYFVFSPGALENFSASFMTSVYVPAEAKGLVSQLFKQFPTLLVIELDLIIERVRALVAQLSQAVGLVFLLVFIGGVLVMLTLVNLSLEQRKQECALLRALGTQLPQLKKMLWLEFCFIGFVSGFVALLISEGLLALLNYFVFNLPLMLHGPLWWFGLPMAVFSVAYVGVSSSRVITKTPAYQVLRAV